MCVHSLCIVVAFRWVRCKIEPVAKTLKIYISPNTVSVHSKCTDATNPTLIVTTDSARVDYVTRQLSSMEMPFGILTPRRQFLSIHFPSVLQLSISHFKNTSDGRTSTLCRCPLFLEVILNLFQLWIWRSKQLQSTYLYYPYWIGTTMIMSTHNGAIPGELPCRHVETNLWPEPHWHESSHSNHAHAHCLDHDTLAYCILEDCTVLQNLQKRRILYNSHELTYSWLFISVCLGVVMSCFIVRDWPWGDVTMFPSLQLRPQ